MATTLLHGLCRGWQCSKTQHLLFCKGAQLKNCSSTSAGALRRCKTGSLKHFCVGFREGINTARQGQLKIVPALLLGLCGGIKLAHSGTFAVAMGRMAMQQDTTINQMKPSMKWEWLLVNRETPLLLWVLGEWQWVKLLPLALTQGLHGGQ